MLRITNVELGMPIGEHAVQHTTSVDADANFSYAERSPVVRLPLSRHLSSEHTGSQYAVSGNVLRFSSAEGLTFDLEDWPAEWATMSDRALVELLRNASAAWAFPDDWTALSDEALLGLLRRATPLGTPRMSDEQRAP